MQVIIPSSDPNLAYTCLESIEERDPNFLGSILIVTDDPVAFRGVIARFPHTAIGHIGEPFNFARWMNYGMGLAQQDDSYFLLNDDTRLLTDNGLSKLEALVEREGGIGILSAAIRGTGGVIEQRQVTPGSVRILKGHISFTAVAIHRRLFDSLGSLDERFVGYGYEDNDFCQRATEAGEAIGVYDGCVFDHYKPHSTFGRGGDFKDKWLLNETLYWEKWLTPQPALVVVGGSRSGAAVYSAVASRMGYAFPDPPAPFETNVSAYYRDELLSRVVRRGEIGVRNYIAGRHTQGKPWGTRIWPSPEMAKRFLSGFAEPPKVLFVIRNTESRALSYAQAHGLKYAEAWGRVEREVADQREILAWAREHLPAKNVKVISFRELIEDTDYTLEELALFLGYEESLSVPRSVVRPEYVTYQTGSAIYQHPAPLDFGRVAVGIRLTHPESSFVGCLARLLRDGLREGDVLLEPAIRTPAHWAASTLMRRFLSSGCDTLLLLDDDMTFPSDMLNQLRDKPENWRYHIVSALATQRVPPPRALVLRRGEQPPLPDALNGLYYNLLVEEVDNGETLPVDGTGFAFTLIRREVIEKMTDAEWGPNYTHYVQWGEGGEGEDVNFCRRAGSFGFTVAVDAACHVGHIGSVVYGYDEFNQWRNTRTSTGLSVDKLIELLESALPNLEGEQAATAVALLSKARE